MRFSGKSLRESQPSGQAPSAEDSLRGLGSCRAYTYARAERGCVVRCGWRSSGWLDGLGRRTGRQRTWGTLDERIERCEIERRFERLCSAHRRLRPRRISSPGLAMAADSVTRTCRFRRWLRLADSRFGKRLPLLHDRRDSIRHGMARESKRFRWRRTRRHPRSVKRRSCARLRFVSKLLRGVATCLAGCVRDAVDRTADLPPHLSPQLTQ
jgi:hypothetical protein